MYLRPVHTELQLSTLYNFIRSQPLGVLTTALQSANHPLLQCSHIPWVLDLPSSFESSTLESGSVHLRGHLARANPHTKALIEAVSSKALESGETPLGEARTEEGGDGVGKVREEVMILFTSPTNHYVTPKFYVSTKPSTGKVVPTWNYAAVQAYGTATIYYGSSAIDQKTGTFLSTQINDLSRMAEEDILGFDGKEGREGPWAVDEAPESYVTLLKRAIIGIEVEVTRLQGKWKMSQELGIEDREGTIKGFEGLGTTEGERMAEIIRERGELKDGVNKA